MVVSPLHVTNGLPAVDPLTPRREKAVKHPPKPFSVVATIERGNGRKRALPWHGGGVGKPGNYGQNLPPRRD